MTILKATTQPAYDMSTNNVKNVLQISESHQGSRRSRGALMSLFLILAKTWHVKLHKLQRKYRKDCLYLSFEIFR